MWAQLGSLSGPGAIQPDCRQSEWSCCSQPATVLKMSGAEDATELEERLVQSPVPNQDIAHTMAPVLRRRKQEDQELRDVLWG